MQKLDRSLGGIKNMGGLPDALFIVDVGYEKIAVNEAQKLGIPVIGVVDTNNSPDGIDYVTDHDKKHVAHQHPDEERPRPPVECHAFVVFFGGEQVRCRCGDRS